jgi:hypothetical protein
MAEYFAWTVTGVITGLKSWSEPDYGSAEDASADGTGAIQIASRMVERQRFLIHQRDGREMEVTLADSGLVLRNGHVVTAVLVARKSLNHGFCVIVDNHTTGAQIRLADNIKRIRPKVGLFRTAKYGMLATLPALLAMALWLLVPGSLGRTDLDSIFLIMSIAIIVLFVIGLIVAKLVLDYLQADDDQKIWQAAEAASTEVRTSIRQNPKSRPRF